MKLKYFKRFTTIMFIFIVRLTYITQTDQEVKNKKYEKYENSLKMAKMADIVFMIVLWIYIYKGAAYITPYKSTWGNSVSNCTIATPTIMFQGTEKDLQVAMNASMIGNKNVWVGYYLAATAFHYVGCIHKGDMTAIADFVYNTPGLCYSACNKTYYIGVSKSKCYCFNNTFPSKRTYQLCSQGCKTQMNIACGSNNFISIYSIDSLANLISGSGRCLQYELRNNTSTWMWANCASENQIICRFNVTSNHEIYDDANTKRKWRPAMNKCFKLSKLPTSVQDLEHFERKSNPGKSWAGVISSDVIYKSDHGAINITPKKFGYLQLKEANHTVLKFDEYRTDQRYTLCQNDKTTETTTFKTTASDIGIAVGVSVATFIIVVIVLVGVILIRRGKVPCMCCKISLHGHSSKCTMNTSLVNSNTIPLNCPNGKVGEVLPQTNIVSEDDVLENNGHLPHNYFILKKTEADNDTTAVQDKINVYNTLASDVKQDANFDNTYDTAEKAAIKLKTKHRVKDDNDANETLEDEDPYNHLNEGERQLKTVRTDNVYGVTQDDEYANCRKTHGKYLQDVEDTYNHTNILQDAEAVEDTNNHTNIPKDVEDDTYNHTSPVS